MVPPAGINKLHRHTVIAVAGLTVLFFPLLFGWFWVIDLLGVEPPGWALALWAGAYFLIVVAAGLMLEVRFNRKVFGG